MVRRNVKEIEKIIVNKILKEMKNNNLVWRNPINLPRAPISGATGKIYKGLNFINLMMMYGGGRYYTIDYIKKNNWKIKDKRKFAYVILYKPTVKKEKVIEKIERVVYNPKTKRFEKVIEEVEKEVEKRITLKRCYIVYHETNLITPNNNQLKEFTLKKEFTDVIERYCKKYGIEISHISGRACYKPLSKRVQVPPLKYFNSEEEYYAALAHEIIHSTMNFLRKIPNNQYEYAFEELIAELGGCMLLYCCGIQPPIKNSSAYIKEWYKMIKEDYTIFLRACNEASKAVDLILSA